MPILRLTQHAESQPHRYRVEVALEGNGPRQTAQVSFGYQLSEQDQENIRWYLEDYLQYPRDPAPQIAARVERRMAEIGIDIFKAIFQGNDDVRDLWATLRPNLNNTRIEILTEIEQAAAIPWELIRDPRTDTLLALRASAFVRIHSQAAQKPKLPKIDGEVIRILLVICRPKGRFDVPFRSVASRILKGLGNQPDSFQLDVLRPPTFETLSHKLQQAKAEGKPYHVVHFDGHGVYSDIVAEKSGMRPIARKMRGYLIFENPTSPDNQEYINGKCLGKILSENNTSILILNACRSAHSVALESPKKVAKPNYSLHDHSPPTKAFGSLAQEVINAGVVGVVAMRYNVYVMTASQFVANLYSSLVQGERLGEAVSLGRRQLNAHPQRTIAFQPISLQDWSVPVVYEATPITLFTKPEKFKELKTIDTFSIPKEAECQLPEAPEVGFLGRDETLLAIERAFDYHSVVLLHAFAGSGKTSTAAEFGKWYASTGGVKRPVLFTSFRRYLPLNKILDNVGQVFQKDLERSGIQWLTLANHQRQEATLHILSQTSILWIWDNVEPISGFPDGELKRWSKSEQQELVDFLKQARTTKVKFLLTSRGEERDWLSNLPVRLQMLPMPFLERIQLTKALAEKNDFQLTDVEDWRPLLNYSQGNPLTISVVVRQALCNKYQTKEQIESFVSKLRSGEAELDDDNSEGRSKSLIASLSYGFIHEFSQEERKQLSLLYLFQELVEASSFWALGDPEMRWCVPELKDTSLEDIKGLLQRAAKVGLLTSLDNRFFEIHPALNFYFRDYYKKFYAESQKRNIYAFIDIMNSIGNQNRHRYDIGFRDVISRLQLEEANLLQAFNLACTWQAWDKLIGIMQGLQLLYDKEGRIAEWKHIVDTASPNFVDPKSFQPLPGRESSWLVLMQYKLRLLRSSKTLEEAEVLQNSVIKYQQKKVDKLFKIPIKDLTKKQREDIRAALVSIEDLGHILREQNKPECLKYYIRSYRLNEKIGSNPSERAVLAFNIGHVFLNIPSVKNLDKAREWYNRSLQNRELVDYLGRAKCFSLLGNIELLRFEESNYKKDSGLNESAFWEQAEKYYNESLRIFLVHGSIFDRGGIFNQLGRLYQYKDIEKALVHYRRAFNYFEDGNETYQGALVCRNIAALFWDQEKFEEALIYARTSLQKLEPFGEVAVLDIDLTQKLIQRIRDDFQ